MPQISLMWNFIAIFVLPFSVCFSTFILVFLYLKCQVISNFFTYVCPVCCCHVINKIMGTRCCVVTRRSHQCVERYFCLWSPDGATNVLNIISVCGHQKEPPMCRTLFLFVITRWSYQCAEYYFCLWSPEGAT